MICRPEWLYKWQDLTGAIIGGAALIITVRWTLRSERRKIEQETKVLRIALGVEFRQSVRYVLRGYLKVARLIGGRAVSTGKILRDQVRFPDPVIYPNSARNVGVLGENTHAVVEFYSKLWSVPDGVYERFPEETVLTRDDLVGVAKLPLEVVEIGIRALPTFMGTPGFETDEQLKDDFVKARAELGSIRSRYRRRSTARRQSIFRYILPFYGRSM